MNRDYQNKIEGPEIDLSGYGDLAYDKDTI